MRITYAHCVKFTHGQLDRYPHSAYEMRSVEVTVWYLPATPECDFDAYHVKDSTGRLIGDEESIEFAIFDAQYRLMDQSREAAKKLSASAQGMEVQA